MKPLSFLVLTDHRGHSAENSLYALVNTLVADPRCALVDVASRGLEANNAFFAGGGARVQGFRVNGELNYAKPGGAFTEATLPFDVEDYDVIWLRLPHPVADGFFDYLAGLNESTIVNDPNGIRRTGDKSFLLDFPELTPPCRLVSTPAEVADFARRFPLVLKPLRAYGGAGIVRVSGPEDESAERAFAGGEGPYLAMKFLKNVSAGDKRILLVNGKVMGASLRLPPPGEWRCNVALGGRSVSADVEPEELSMVEVLAPALRRHGICFAGIDTLLNDDGKRVLSEINTLSIGGFPQAKAQSGRPVLQMTIDELFNYCYAHLDD